MKQHFIEYCRAVGLSEVLLKRVESIVSFYADTVKVNVEDIFISEYIDKDGARQYESLWLFASSHWMEAKTFLVADIFDSADMQDVIKYWKLEKTEYDFLQATEKSRLTVTVGTEIDISAEFKASKENCDYLRALFLKRVCRL